MPIAEQMQTELVTQAPKRRAGRKPREESRAQELRDRLKLWLAMPRWRRPSLRSLAAEMQTSHQLLGHHLNVIGQESIEADLPKVRNDFVAKVTRLGLDREWTAETERWWRAWRHKLWLREIKEATEKERRQGAKLDALIARIEAHQRSLPDGHPFKFKVMN